MKINSTILTLFAAFFVFLSCNYTGENKNSPNWIRAHYKNDPATSVVIGWHRQKSNTRDDRIYFDTIDHGTNIAAYANEMVPDLRTNYFKMYNAFVELKNLKPDTKYYFVIANTYGISKRYYVQTLPDRNDVRLSIIAGGDSRNNRVPRRAGNELVRKLKPHFVTFGGDMTDSGTGNQWAGWLDDWQLTIGKDGRVTPIIMARGNHEKSNKVLQALFWAHENNYYALGIAGNLLRMYTLNSEISTGGNQLDWLNNDLSANQNYKWKFVQYHRPMRPHSRKKINASSVYRNWSELFFKYSVDLVVESDSHLVKSTWPIRPSIAPDNVEGFVRDDQNGTVYVGEGSWGAPLRKADDNKSWTRDSGSFNQFKWIFLDYNSVQVRTVKIDNAAQVEELTIDSRFTIPYGLDIWNPSNGDVVYLD